MLPLRKRIGRGGEELEACDRERQYISVLGDFYLLIFRQ